MAQLQRTVPTKIRDIVQHIQSKNVNLLAIDFDQTFIDIHTGGRWQGTSYELTEHVRRDFQQLVWAAHDANIRVAIVTFSPQTTIIKGTLEYVLGEEDAGKIVVRGNDHSWQYEGKGFKHGKQQHMASATEEFEASGDIEITRATTVLIDDDKNNIQMALEQGVRAIFFRPHRPEELLVNLQNLS